MTALVSFSSQAGDCVEMMSAHLSRPIIAAASAVRAAEAATWAEAQRVCMCVESVDVCERVEMEIRRQGCMRTGLLCAKIPIGKMYMHTQSKSKAQRRILLKQAGAK